MSVGSAPLSHVGVTEGPAGDRALQLAALVALVSVVAALEVVDGRELLELADELVDAWG
jgi:hypothetical protein